MENILSNKDFHYITKNDREFLIEFDKKICALGFERIEIGDFLRWGNKTIAYIKPKVKAKNYISKIFFDGINIYFRLYFNNIDKHAKYIENAPNHIKEVFTNDVGRCEHCGIGGCVKPDGSCSHRKTYIINEVIYEKCDGKVFYFQDFNLDKLNDYISLITTFFPIKNSIIKIIV